MKLSKSLLAVQLISDPQPGLEIAVEVATASPIEARQKSSTREYYTGGLVEPRPEGWREKLEDCNISNRVVDCHRALGNVKKCLDPEKHKWCECRDQKGAIHHYICYKE